jgi:outer membrane lipoprotein-sorting protein
MGELGDLLECLHRADESFQTVQASFRFWRHSERQQQAFKASFEPESGPPRAASVTAQATTAVGGVATGASDPEIGEFAVSLWFERPSRIREEREGDPHGFSYGVRVGRSWWSFNDHFGGALTNRGDEHQQSQIGADLLALVEPSRVLGALAFEALGSGERAGRKVMCATARPRPGAATETHLSSPLHWLGRGADEYELEVDTERGTILRCEARRSGLAFLLREARSIHFDEPIPPERFVFEPPAGETLRTVAEAFGRTSPFTTLGAAVAEMPFTVLVPEAVPEDWRLLVQTRQPGERTTHPAMAFLIYQSSDPAFDLRISQKSARSSAPLPGGAQVEWTDKERGGVAMKVCVGERGQPAHVMCQREGTTVTLSSRAIGSDELMNLAAGLVPASATPPQT